MSLRLRSLAVVGVAALLLLGTGAVLGQRSPARVAGTAGTATPVRIDRLSAAIEARIAATRTVLDLVLDGADGAGISWLYRNAEVLTKKVRDDGRVAMSVRVDPTKVAMVKAKFAT